VLLGYSVKALAVRTGDTHFKFGMATECLVRNLRSFSWSVGTKDVIKLKLHGLSPPANCTDRATAACRRSDCQLFADRRCHMVSVTDPYGRILGFLDGSRYFSIK
jgi:hypothetical protein